MIKSEFLENFCSSKSYLFNEPFINGKYVVATDSHSLIAVNKEEVEINSPLKESEKDYIGIVEEGKGDEVKNIKFTYSELLDALKQVPVSDSDSEEHCCPDCDGYGEVDFEYHSTHDYEYTLRGECPVCHGTGINDNFLYLHNVRGWFDKTLTAIETGGIWFNPKYIDDLVRIMKELEITSCTMECGSINSACLFILNDKVKFYLMPIFHSDSVENIIHIEHKSKINLHID